jgi:hypothetical protein
MSSGCDGRQDVALANATIIRKDMMMTLKVE